MILKYYCCMMLDLTPVFREEESLDNIKQVYFECSNKEEKFQALSNIYGTISIGQSMIFCHVSSSYYLSVSSIWGLRLRVVACPDKEDGILAGRKDVWRRSCSSRAEWGTDCRAESCCHQPFQRWQRESAHYNQCFCQR